MRVPIREQHAAALERLGRDLMERAWELALETVEEGLGGELPSLARLGRLGQLGDVPTFVAELGRELAQPRRDRVAGVGPLAQRAREHAREREALGFAPREIVTEFLILRRVLWRFVSRHADRLDAADVLEVERRLNDTIDQLITECVVAYFDRATSELAFRARHDPLTELLNHQAFTQQLERELERARRYEHGLTLVSFDIDRFKAINDTLGHPQGDRVLRRTAGVVREILRGSDVAGRMGGDEFSVLLIESDEETAGRFLARLADRLDEEVAAGDLPPEFGVSPGTAHFPHDGADADTLFRVADQRLYETKRTHRAA